MTDLLCLVADKNMEAAVEGILRRPLALRTRAFGYEIVRHPRHDPGCFHSAQELLDGYRVKAAHAVVLLDRAWDGAPPESASQMEVSLEGSWKPEIRGWARAVVIDPELEAWVFSDSPHVAQILNWPADTANLRASLVAAQLWADNAAKPADPKAAVDWTLRRTRLPRSSAIYRNLASRVSFERCDDRSFLRFMDILRGWFTPAAPAN